MGCLQRIDVVVKRAASVQRGDVVNFKFFLQGDKAVKRAARKRDANPHYNGGSKRKGGPDAKTLVDNASKKRKKR